MNKSTVKRRLTIIAFLAVFAVAVWYGGNWHMAGRLDPISLTEYGDEDAVLWILKWRPEMATGKARSQQSGPSDQDLLQVAAQHGRTRIIHRLLELGVDPDWQDHFTKETALHYAAANGHTTAIQMLIANGATPTPVSNDGSSALDYAVNNRNVAAAEVLIKAGGQSTSMAPIVDAINEADATQVELLLRGGVDPDSPDGRLNTLLHYASRSLDSGSAEVVQVLIKNGAKPSPQNSAGRTPLDFVLGGVNGSTFLVLRQMDVMRRLGCDSAFSSAYPLHAAAAAGDVALVRRLLAEGASARQRTIAEKVGVMRDEQLPVLRILSEFGTLESLLGISGEVVKGETPLHRAGSAETVRVLVKAGADPNMVDSTGKTPLLRAYLTGYLRDTLRRQSLLDQRRPIPPRIDYDPPVITALLTAGADVKQADATGRTLLHYAVLLMHPRVIKRCIDSGANLNAPDKSGCHPLNLFRIAQVAFGKRFKASALETRELLRKGGAKPNKAPEVELDVEEVIHSNLPL